MRIGRALETGKTDENLIYSKRISDFSVDRPMDWEEMQEEVLQGDRRNFLQNLFFVSAFSREAIEYFEEQCQKEG